MRFAFRRQKDCMKRNQTPRVPWLLKLAQNDLVVQCCCSNIPVPYYFYTLCFTGELSWLPYLPTRNKAPSLVIKRTWVVIGYSLFNGMVLSRVYVLYILV